MVKKPKQLKAYCPYPKCKRHRTFKVDQYKARKARKLAQGQRRYERKQAGYGGQTKPVLRRKAKTTKKVTLKLTCQTCKKIVLRPMKRCKYMEITNQAKVKGAVTF